MKTADSNDGGARRQHRAVLDDGQGIEARRRRLPRRPRDPVLQRAHRKVPASHRQGRSQRGRLFPFFSVFFLLETTLPFLGLQKRAENDLLELRNNAVSAFYIINALYITAVFLLTLEKENVYLRWPFGEIYEITYTYRQYELTGEVRSSSTPSTTPSTFRSTSTDPFGFGLRRSSSTRRS